MRYTEITETQSAQRGENRFFLREQKKSVSAASRQNEVTERIIGCAIEVHRHLGPGLLESTYERCLAKEFDVNEVSYERQKLCPLSYKGMVIEEGYRVDFLVEDAIILEIKSIEEFTRVHEAQLLTYLRLLEKPHGLLLNFNAPVLKAGIKRLSL